MKTKTFPLRAIAILVAVFLLGSVFGAGILVFTVRTKLQKMVQLEEPGPRVKKNFARLNAHLERTLDLTPSESDTVKSELNTTMINIVKIRASAFKDVRRETIDSIDRISNQLPEEKGSKLRAMAKRRLSPWGMVGPNEPE